MDNGSRVIYLQYCRRIIWVCLGIGNFHVLRTEFKPAKDDSILLWRVYMRNILYPTALSRSRRLFCSIPHMNILYCFLLCFILGNHSLIIIYAMLVGKIHLVTVYVYTISCLCINTYIAISVHRKYLYYTFIHINLSCVIRLKQRVISDWYAWWRFSG